MEVLPEQQLQIGFTGTRHGMTSAQRAAVMALLDAMSDRVGFGAHHGDCVGADAEFHDVCALKPLCRRAVHPWPLDDLPHQAGRIGDSRRDNLGHMRRNKSIMMSSTVMIAAPYEPEEQSYGGT